MLHPLDLHKDFIDEEGVAVSFMLPSQSLGKLRAEFIAPKSNRFIADGDSSLSHQVFDEWSGTPAVTQVESVVEPDGVLDDFWRKAVAFVHFRLSLGRIQAAWELTCQYHQKDHQVTMSEI